MFTRIYLNHTIKNIFRFYIKYELIILGIIFKMQIIASYRLSKVPGNSSILFHTEYSSVILNVTIKPK